MLLKATKVGELGWAKNLGVYSFESFSHIAVRAIDGGNAEGQEVREHKICARPFQYILAWTSIRYAGYNPNGE